MLTNRLRRRLTVDSAVLNPAGHHYEQLKSVWKEQYEDSYWSEDAVVLERNSRDFVSRVDRINVNAEAICDLLQEHPRGKNDPHRTIRG